MLRIIHNLLKYQRSYGTRNIKNPDRVRQMAQVSLQSRYRAYQDQ